MVKDEEGRPFTDAPSPLRRCVPAWTWRARSRARPGSRGLVLRYGFFYGPGTYYAHDGYLAEETRKRRQPMVGGGSGVFSFIHVDDAADATVAASSGERRASTTWLRRRPGRNARLDTRYAEAVGAKKPLRAAQADGRLVAGPMATTLATGLRGASNAKAKRELGWQPSYSSWREGFREALG